MAIHLPTGADADEPALPHRERYECPISTCRWAYEVEPAPVLDPGVLAHIFGPGIMSMQAVNKHRAQIERALEEHFRHHTATEYLAEITTLGMLCESLTAQLEEITKVARQFTAQHLACHHPDQTAPKLGEYVTGP